MAKMNMIAALNSALEHQLQNDPNVVIFGEDVGYFGGVFRVTAGLQEKYGPHRVFDSPLAEGGIAAIAMGMGLNIATRRWSVADYIFPPTTKSSTKSPTAAGQRRILHAHHLPHPRGGDIGGHHPIARSQFTHTPKKSVLLKPSQRQRPADKRHRVQRPGDFL